MFRKFTMKFDKFMEQVKLGADMVTYAQLIKLNRGIPVYDENIVAHIEGFPIYFNKALKGYGTICAVSTYVNNKGVILVDNYFSRLSPIAKKFVLHHEVGHIKGEHLSKAIEIAKGEPTVVEVMELEYEADSYAFDKMGLDAINGLLELRELVKDLLPDTNVLKHLDMRIEVLKEKSCVL